MAVASVNVAVAAVLGGLAGAALVGAWRSLCPLRAALDDALAKLGRVPEPPRAAPAPAGVTGPLAARLGSVARRAGFEAHIGGRLRADLALLGRSPEDHLGSRCVGALAGALLPTLWVGALSVVGLARTPALPTLAVAVGLGAAGFFLPDVLVHQEAAERRQGFVVAFGTFLDMVAVGLAGGVGVEGALLDAARIGRGREAGVLRAVLEDTRLSGESQWAALRRLGVELRIPELVEAASTVSLAGTEGARVRRSLEARARAMRARELSGAEARAESATERMAIPTALLMLGFLLVVGFPAVSAVLAKAS
ncbi:MAG TPA: type II secretion system F family protein [Acidimicrobiales bacterium]|nr:type II secretion system F family protein [Acidimicrobiales bacterium]